MSFASGLTDYHNKISVISDDGSALTYSELAIAADNLYQGSGMPKPHGLVAIECSNKVVCLAAYLGALRAGIPALLVDANLDQQLKHRLYEHYQIPWVFDQAGNWQPTFFKSPIIHPDAALLLSTSGSTGSQKLVKLTLANLDANARSIARYLKITSNERPISSLPLHYSYGLSVVNSHLLMGATLLLTQEPITSRKFWDFFTHNRATSFSGVPTSYAMLRQLRFERMQLPDLKTLTQAGGKLAPEQVKWFAAQAREKGYEFYVMYGQTEATARIAYVPFASLPEKADAIGVVIPGGKLDLIAEDSSIILECGIKGELRYTGPNVMMGYAEDVAALAEPDQLHGTLLTGDLAWRDDDGFYHLAGRLKRFIKVYGNRISLDEVEAQLHADEINAAVTGTDEQLLIAVRNYPDVQSLGHLIAARYRIHHLGVKVVAVNDFPLSSSGKVQYQILLSQLMNNE